MTAMQTREAAAGLAAEYLRLQQELRRIEESISAVSNAIKAIWSEDPQAFDETPVRVDIRRTGYSQGLVALLKAKGLGQYIEVKESVPVRVVDDLVAGGLLAKEEVEPYAKPPALVIRERKEGGNGDAEG